ncbi:hypothetical protein E2C01_033715 [Portunus trituberculatus]|uniref:Uncharacterized protein n=1 Tax=Portunus trituberculatus TaxID=210409 RepID=A0A5B7EYM1_PORTR|nr:hypothetical protein [Portunus trituberculatus]
MVLVMVAVVMKGDDDDDGDVDVCRRDDGKQMASVCVAGVRGGPLGMVMTAIVTTMTATLTADVGVKRSGI